MIEKRNKDGTWTEAIPIPFQYPDWVNKIPIKFFRNFMKKLVWNHGEKFGF